MINMCNFKNNMSFILRFSANDFKSRFSGSTIGRIWSIAEPLVTVLLYRFVYTVTFGGNDVLGIPYYLWLSVGIALWFFVSDGLKSVCNVYLDYSYLIKKVSLNKKLLPVSRAFSALYSHILFLLVVLTLCFFKEIYIKSFFYLSIMVVICFILIVLLGKVLAILCAYIKDVHYILGVALNIVFWLTPIFWDMNLLPNNLKYIVNINPIALIAEGYRNAFFYGEPLSANKIVYLIGFLVILYIISFVAERKLLPCLTDKL